MELSQLEDVFLQRLQQLCPSPSPFVVGVSGGADSMALLTLLVNVHSRWPVPIVPVHVDHGIRSNSSEDALFVEATSRDLFGLEVATEHIHVTPETGESLEMAARRERYALLEKHRRMAGEESLIVVGHHRRDQAETVLMRLVNGTGIQGLQGMRGRNGKIIRPLLTFSPTDLRHYLQLRQVPWRDDESNQDIRFFRNRVRWELLPLLADRFNPQIEEALAAVAQRAQEAYAVIHEQAEDFMHRAGIHSDQDILLLPTEFAALRTAVQADIFETVASRWGVRVNRDHIQQAIRGRANWPRGMRVARDGRGRWVLSRQERPAVSDPVWPEQILPEEGSVDLPQMGQLVISLTHFSGSPRGVVSVDKKRWPRLWVRPWLHGDRIEPLGMKGHHKKIGDIFTDNKVPRSDRRGWPLIVDAGDHSRVLAIAGIMTAEDARCEMGALCTRIRYVNEAFPS
ncbi:MAG: tRNA lysidine(34) synthetase TilS [Firmicutes bacterium]|nr:tRNA lysidine(34) synthetase TilS [Bacillota bacterium]MCL5014299.1 tRNA lysidine(34) synthetase TilS [Bacillota bacterium]